MPWELHQGKAGRGEARWGQRQRLDGPPAPPCSLQTPGSARGRKHGARSPRRGPVTRWLPAHGWAPVASLCLPPMEIYDGRCHGNLVTNTSRLGKCRTKCNRAVSRKQARVLGRPGSAPRGVQTASLPCEDGVGCGQVSWASTWPRPAPRSGSPSAACGTNAAVPTKPRLVCHLSVRHLRVRHLGWKTSGLNVQRSASHFHQRMRMVEKSRARPRLLRAGLRAREGRGTGTGSVGGGGAGGRCRTGASTEPHRGKPTATPRGREPAPLRAAAQHGAARGCHIGPHLSPLLTVPFLPNVTFAKPREPFRSHVIHEPTKRRPVKRRHPWPAVITDTANVPSVWRTRVHTERTCSTRVPERQAPRRRRQNEAP